MGISLNPSSLLSGQGIDVNTIVSEVLSQQSGQLTEWQNEQSTLQTQASLLTGINSDLSNLANAVTALSDPLGALTSQSATSSNTSVLTATADSTAVAGNHTIVVSNLATTGTVYTNAVSGGANVSILPSGATSGDLTIQIGGSSGTTADIQITAGSNDTLTTLAASINQQSAQNNWGISAAVVTDATGARLTLSSQSTGSPGALAITNNTTSLTFNPPTGGTNSSFSIDGIPFSTTSNTVTGAIPGVTLNLASSAPNSSVELTVGPNSSQVTEAVNNFVNAYNTVINDINQQFTVNAATNSEGPLGSDSALRTLQSILMNDVTYSVPGNGGTVNLASLGINMNDDGTLTVGNTPSGQSMSEVLATNPQAFQAFFQNSTNTGFANNFNTDLTNLTDPTEGLLNVDLAQNQTEQQNLTDSINNFEDQLNTEQTNLTQEFSSVNASLQEYPLLLQQVTETLATLDSSSSSSSGSTTPTLTSGL
ncbi:MAG TPA: flagellar filament capping protein FliD [Candidatus Acidoferrales bacterium]|nr:flagellar filament capping protein FliD [Candidatus Acidoferrales bacterium]